MAFTRPDEFLTCIEQVDVDDLVARGFTTLLIDIDNTLVPRDTKELPASVREWFFQLKKNNLHICLVSNNWSHSVLRYADELEVPAVHRAVKPVPFGLLKGIKKSGGSRQSALVIGDQLLTDTFGAHFLGMYAILVLPQARKDLRHTLLLRRIERFLMRGMTPSR